MYVFSENSQLYFLSFATWLSALMNYDNRNYALDLEKITNQTIRLCRKLNAEMRKFFTYYI